VREPYIPDRFDAGEAVQRLKQWIFLDNEIFLALQSGKPLEIIEGGHFKDGESVKTFSFSKTDQAVQG
jgi:hypothetical protein